MWWIPVVSRALGAAWSAFQAYEFLDDHGWIAKAKAWWKKRRA